MNRVPIPHAVQVEVFFRDGWLCSHCRRPTVFHLALKLLAELIAPSLPGHAVAYWHPNWRRDAAPLLDELGASVDHIEAFAKGGAHDVTNFATICSRCNARKGTRSREEHRAVHSPWVVKGKHGEPTAWDGLASTYVVLARRTTRPLSASEKGWLTALEVKIGAPAR
jgi:5-methylcytosine-specific restriction endonuclease McrA